LHAKGEKRAVEEKKGAKSRHVLREDARGKRSKFFIEDISEREIRKEDRKEAVYPSCLVLSLKRRSHTSDRVGSLLLQAGASERKIFSSIPLEPSPN